MTDAQKKEPIKCRQCGANMELLTAKKYTGNWPAGLMGIGVLCTLLIGGPLLGIPLLLLGVYQYTAKHTISYCSACGYHFKVWKAESS